MKKTSKKRKSSKKLLEKVLESEERIIAEEKKLEREEDIVEKQEEAQLEELKELEIIEKDIQQEVKGSPLGRITYRDFTKSLIGALFGVLGHFAYHLGPEIAEKISMTRASILYATSLLIAILFVYFAGFRRVDKKNAKWLPIRVVVIYLTSLIVIVGVLAVFGDITHEMHWEEIYKTISTISILAVLGAAAADLLGREE